MPQLKKIRSFLFIIYIDFFNRLQLPLKKSGGTAGILYNNRHRQAPRTHIDIQAVRALEMSEPILYILVYFESYIAFLQSYAQNFHYATSTSLQAKISNKIGGFVVQGIIIQN